MDFIFKITVFTPTYNRSYTLEKLYYSLKCQTFTNFEWLVVDDGSVDNTEEVLKKWIEEKNLFTIRYFKQSNGGKCRAINKALDLAHGELFFIVDSDDYLTDDALEKIVKWEAQLPSNKMFCGISGNLGVSLYETPNKQVIGEFYDGNLLDRYKEIDGERAFAFYTEIHRDFRYPEFDGEKFMTEAVVYNRMAHMGYKMRFYNDIICVYEYKEDGLTKAGAKLFLKNPRGYGLWLREKNKFEGSSITGLFKMFYTFTCDLSTQYTNKQIAEYIGTNIIVISLCSILHKVLKLLKKYSSIFFG